MTDYFSLPLMNVYTFDPSTGKLSSKHMHLPTSSESTSPAAVYTPGALDAPTPELVSVGRGRAVYFLQTPTEETPPEQAATRERAVRKAKKRVQELERMAEELEKALLEDSAPDAQSSHGEELEGDQSFVGDASYYSDAEETFSDDGSDYSDDSYASDTDDSDSDDDDDESVDITWEAEPSISATFSSGALSSSESWASCEAVSFSIPPARSSGISPLAAPEDGEMSVDYEYEEEMSEVYISEVSLPTSRSSRIQRIFDELEASDASLPAIPVFSPTLPSYRDLFAAGDRDAQLDSSDTGLADLAADELDLWGVFGTSIDDCLASSSGAEQPEEPAATAPAIVLPEPAPPAIQQSVPELAAADEVEEEWEADLFGDDADAPEPAHAHSVTEEHSVVRPVHEQSSLPKQAEPTGVLTLDCALPIIPAHCDIFASMVAPSLAASSMPRPLGIAAASISVADKTRKKRKADDDDEPHTSASAAEHLRKKVKLAHTVVAPAPAVSLRKGIPAARGSQLKSMPLAKPQPQRHLPIPAALPSLLVQPSLPNRPSSIGSAQAKGGTAEQSLKRKRHTADDMEDSDSDSSDDDIPLARKVVRARPAKKLRTVHAMPAAMPRRAAAAFATLPAPAPNAF